MAPDHEVKVLEHCRVSPPPGISVAQKSIPLTFFDITFLYFPTLSSYFFYELPHPTTHFTNTILPNLKHSLSLTLQHFYPLAGKLIWSSESAEPDIRYVDGDSISLTIAESSGDFSHLSGNHPRDVNQFHPLVPPLSPFSECDQPVSLLALQVTLFPNSGICVGVTSSHVPSDARTIIHFMRSWASVCRLGEASFMSEPLPFCDRTVIKDPNGLKTVFLNQVGKPKPKPKEPSSEQSVEVPSNHIFQTKIAQATFPVCRTDVDRLKQLVLAKRKKDDNQMASPLHLSTFTIICAHTWICLMKAGAIGGDVKKEWEHLLFSADCRSRLDPEVPATYLGNCLTFCFAKAKRSDLMGDDGMAIAAEAIASTVKRKLEEGVLRGAENWISDMWSVVSQGIASVTGSPKFGIYETDFGWGKPKKYEVLSIGESAFALYDSRDEKSALEVYVSLPKHKMDTFVTLFSSGLKVNLS